MSTSKVYTKLFKNAKNSHESGEEKRIHLYYFSNEDENIKRDKERGRSILSGTKDSSLKVESGGQEHYLFKKDHPQFDCFSIFIYTIFSLAIILYACNSQKNVFFYKEQRCVSCLFNAG